MTSKKLLLGLSLMALILSGCQFNSAGQGPALTGVYAGIGPGAPTSPPNVYKSCSLDTHKVIYKAKRSPLCGGGTEVVDNYRGPECGVETYKSCRTSTNPVEDYEIQYDADWQVVTPQGDGFNDGWIEDPTPDDSSFDYQADCVQRARPYAKEKQASETDPNYIWWPFDAEVEHGTHVVKKFVFIDLNPDPKDDLPKPAYRCSVAIARYRKIYKDQPNPSCGPDTYKECTATVNKECRLQQFGIEGYESEIDPNCGVESQLAGQQDDETYFKILTAEFRSLIADHGARSLRWENAEDLSQESNLKGRVISFGSLAEMKMIANSVDLNNTVSAEQKNFNRYFKLLAVDAYIRLATAYNQQRLKDVLAIEDMMAQVQNQTLGFAKAAEQAQDKIKNFGLSKNVADAIISDIQKAHDTDAKAVIGVFKDLAQMIRKGIQLSISETDGWVRSLAATDSLFQANMIEVFLMSGDFDQAQLKLVDAAAEFRKQSDPKLTKKNDWFFQNLQKNAQIRAQQELDGANQFFQVVTTTAAIPTVMKADNGSEVLIPTSVLAILTELQLTGGEALDGTKFQLLDLIDKNLIQPLTDFIAKTDIVL